MVFSCFTIGCLPFLKTRNPQMHFISGSFDNSVLVTGVPHLMHSYTTSPNDSVLSIIGQLSPIQI